VPANSSGVVVLNQFFYPDTVATAQMLSDAAIGLARSGPVTAISGAAEAPGVLPGIRTIRTRNFAFRRSTASRLNSYASFMLGAAWNLIRIPKSEAVLTLTTPPLLSLLGTMMQGVRGSRHYIWEMDVYPDIATELGVFKRGGFLARFIAALANWSRRRADGIIVLGEEMKARLVTQGVPVEKITVCENWADGHEITPLPFPAGPLTILYSGNFGFAHEFDTIAGTIRRLGCDPRFQFIFSGGGTRFEKLKILCRERGLTNVDFQPFCPRAELSSKLAQGHLGLVTQLPESLGSLVPSKTYGIMAAGRPIVYIGPKAATPARHIEHFQCGWCVEPGEVESLVALLETLAAQRQAVYDAGRRAREAFDQHFDMAIGVARICAVVNAHRVPLESRVSLKSSRSQIA
jgi:colanic acid biosynthesis glycosyl transferase WcaI